MCKYCSGACIRRGKSQDIQRYKCKICSKSFLKDYRKQKIPVEQYVLVHRLNNEGCGISSIGRLLNISKSSVQRVIIRLFASISRPEIQEKGESYEIDELRTYCGNKKNECWLIYAINRKTRKIIDFCVGRRTKENIKKVVDKLLKMNPKKIHTDGLNIYQGILKEDIHVSYSGSTNRIERKNLTLRTLLKRLSRRTICFTRSKAMLESSVGLLIYA
jgi:IS1 family transposase